MDINEFNNKRKKSAEEALSEKREELKFKDEKSRWKMLLEKIDALLSKETIFKEHKVEFPSIQKISGSVIATLKDFPKKLSVAVTNFPKIFKSEIVNPVLKTKITNKTLTIDVKKGFYNKILKILEESRPKIDENDYNLKDLATELGKIIKESNASLIVPGPAFSKVVIRDPSDRTLLASVTANGLKVDANIDEIPLPLGAATSAKQLPDNHNVTVSNPTADPETGLAKDATFPFEDYQYMGSQTSGDYVYYGFKQNAGTGWYIMRKDTTDDSAWAYAYSSAGGHNWTTAWGTPGSESYGDPPDS